jgi:hypothetical protein|tara:strand:- start:231 stop:488 length:258 start_codon:yes stop_codon:yes gene_type:complete
MKSPNKLVKYLYQRVEARLIEEGKTLPSTETINHAIWNRVKKVDWKSIPSHQIPNVDDLIFNVKERYIPAGRTTLWGTDKGKQII